jgi:hypothetical protein
MKVLSNLTRTVKDAYWDVVQECLTDIFQVPPPVASSVCKDRRADVEFAPKNVNSDIFYHREPFDVAEDLVKACLPAPAVKLPNLDDPSVEAKYNQILGQYGLGP